ncbi:Kelch repeat-containing protein [Flavobacterium praedii]|uniref:Kelch repeat-containing protein n=1 Tax=Flavobacterium praedii TaxID=3002900 RepID=UPI002481A550|nr:kelch repeat-containing protein [Flavobacterium praedii]
MKHFKKGIILSTLLISLFSISCSDDDTEEKLGNWIKKSAFDGPARSSATSFVIGSFAYVTTGYTGDEYLNDLWAYNSAGDYWEQKADFIGIARSSGSGFELNGNGYVGLGYDGTNKLKDFYEYNPDTNIWTKKTDFAGTARYGAVGFQVGGKAFFGTGYDGNYLKDFYQYNATDNTWTQVNGFSGNKRRNATVFVINDIAYLGTGLNSGVNQVDFWAFDPITDVWTRKRDLDDDGTDHDAYSIKRANASSFSINSLGYITCGESGRTIWEYNPKTDIWKEKTSLEGSGRSDALGITIKGERGFVMLGKSGTSYFDDVWEFKPSEEQNDDDN